MSKQLAETINGLEFDHPFTIHPDGTLSEPQGIYAPNVYNDDEADISIDGKGWSALTGMTGQWGYSGAVMHPSEYVGKGIADYLAEMAADAERPLTFVLTVVECLPDDDDHEPDPAGWAILVADGVAK